MDLFWMLSHWTVRYSLRPNIHRCPEMPLCCRASEGRHGGLVKSPLGCKGTSAVSGRPDKTTRTKCLWMHEHMRTGSFKRASELLLHENGVSLRHCLQWSGQVCTVAWYFTSLISLIYLQEGDLFISVTIILWRNTHTTATIILDEM